MTNRPPGGKQSAPASPAAPPRLAFFLDYENFFSALRQRGREALQPYGASPRLDFEQLTAFIGRRFGRLAPDDFVVVANFTHFDPQKGGLNRAATLINVDSFKHRLDRQSEQSSPGKRHVEKNYADLRLAFEVGQHAQRDPAEVYLLASGDGAFAALGLALREQGRQVVFVLADPDKSARLIKEGFIWFDVLKSGAVLAGPPELEEPEAEAAEQTPAMVLEYLEVLSSLRQALTAPVPAALMRAVYGPQLAGELQRQAYGRGFIDQWDDPAGVACLSRREERVQGKIYPMPVRPDLAARAAILEALAQAGAGRVEPTRVYWRRMIKEQAGLSNHAAKQALDELLAGGILRDGQLERAHLSLEAMVAFLRRGSGG